MLLYLKLAARNAFKNIKKNIYVLCLTCLGFLGIMTVKCLSTSVINYQRNSVVFDLIGMLQVSKAGYLKNIFQRRLDFLFEDTPALRQKILSTPHVEVLTPMIKLVAVVADSSQEPQKNYFLNISAIDPHSVSQVSWFALPWISPLHKNFNFLTQDNIVVSPLNHALFATNFKEKPLILAFNKDGEFSAELTKPVGFIKKFSPFEGDLANIDFARKLLKIGANDINVYSLKIDSFKNLQLVQQALQAKLSPQYEVNTWEQVSPVWASSVQSQSFAFNFIMILIFILVLIANYTIIYGLLQERKAEIGVMMSVGVSNRKMRILYLIEGCIIGFVGVVFGNILYFIIIKIANYFGGLVLETDGSSLSVVHHVVLIHNYSFIAQISAFFVIMIGLFYYVRFHMFSKFSSTKLLSKI